MSKIYNSIITEIDKFVPNHLQNLWNHPAGPKTIFFWAPTVKWGLVIAGVQDVFRRKADQISISQAASLTATGIIWSRYSLVIEPKNYNLFSVNAFIALIQGYQLMLAYKHRRNLKKTGKTK